MTNSNTRWRAKTRADIDHEISLATKMSAGKLFRAVYYFRPNGMSFTGTSEIAGIEAPKLRSEADIVKVLLIGSRMVASIDTIRRYRLSQKQLDALIANKRLSENARSFYALMTGKKRSIANWLRKASLNFTKTKHETRLATFQYMVIIADKLERDEPLTDNELWYIKQMIDVM